MGSNKKPNKKLFNTFLALSGNGIGGLVAIFRIIFEPYVFYIFKKTFCSCFFSKRLKKVPKESLCSLTNSALNIELVYVILTGINTLMKQDNIDFDDQKSVRTV